MAKEVIGDATIFYKTVQTEYQIIILRCARKAGFTVFWAKLGIKSGACWTRGLSSHEWIQTARLWHFEDAWKYILSKTNAWNWLYSVIKYCDIVFLLSALHMSCVAPSANFLDLNIVSAHCKYFKRLYRPSWSELVSFMLEDWQSFCVTEPFTEV